MAFHPSGHAGSLTPSKVLQLVLDDAKEGGLDSAERHRSMRYYESDQTNEALRAYRDVAGLWPHETNLMAREINSVLGAERKHRRDWVVRADTDADTEVAEAQNQRVNEIMRMTDANNAISNAVRPMMISGIGWVHVGRSTNPFDFPYRIKAVLPHEMLFDRHSREMDGSDCRWQCRRRFLSEDEAHSLFPDHLSLIKDVFSRYGGFEALGGDLSGWDNMHTGVAAQEYRGEIFRNLGRPMVGVYDVTYKAYEEIEVLRFEDGRVVEYNKEDPVHTAAKLGEEVRPTMERLPVMRRAWFVGPYLVEDERSDDPHEMFPYVRFQAYQEESTNICYGLGRLMIPSQDAYNAATVKIYSLLESVRVMMEENSLGGKMSTADLMREVVSKNSLIITKVGKLGAIQVEENWQEIERLEVIRATAREEMRAASGISRSFTGDAQEQQSGVAISNLAQLTDATLASATANISYGRKLVGELVLAYVVDEMRTRPMEVPIANDAGKVIKQIGLNQITDTGEITNAVQLAKTRVVLAEIETTDGYRQQHLALLERFVPSAPAEMQGILLRTMMSLSGLPDRHEVMEEIDKILGRAATDEEQEAIDAQQAEAQAIAQQLAMRREEAEIAKLEAEAAHENAEAAKATAQAEAESRPEVAANDPVMERKKAMVQQMRQDLAARALPDA